MDGKIITLTRPVEVFGKEITEITLREPTGALFSRLGHPRIPVMNATANSGYWVEKPAVISAYLDALIDLEAAELHIVLKKLSLADSIHLQSSLFDFFNEALATNAAANPVVPP
jgi:hypothetical protein